MGLTYNPIFLTTEQAKFGLKPEELTQFLPVLTSAIKEVKAAKASQQYGFAKLPHATAEVSQIKMLADEIVSKYNSVVLIGIGGQDLGVRAVNRALGHQFRNFTKEARKGYPQLFFIGNTTDPEPIYELLDLIDLNTTLIIMSSKSGNTVEQMASFLILRDKLIDTVGVVRAKEQILTITDAKTGTLRQITDLEGYRSVSMPDDVGGRYSVLSIAGLLPLACVGVEIERLLEGARDIDQLDDRGVEVASDNYAGVSLAAQYAYHQYLAYERHQIHQNVLFMYSYKMREIGSWYRQLWAESLGKRLNRLEEEVNLGPTPISSLGPTDQHSQCQLYMEGPADKIFTFVRVKNVPRDIVLPDAYPDLEGVNYLKGINLQKILLAEQEATAEALARAGKPSVLLELSELDAYSLGQLLYFFELATVYAGALWNINPFDQPGVELGKKLMFQKLGRKGFEKVA